MVGLAEQATPRTTRPPLFFYLLDDAHRPPTPSPGGLDSRPASLSLSLLRKLAVGALPEALWRRAYGGRRKAPELAEEYSLPLKDVPVENLSAEKSSDSTVAEVVPEKDTETPAADDTTAVVDDKGETPEVTESSEKPEEGSNAAAEETSDEKKEIKIETAPADFRFPTTNQTRHCFTRYIEYHRCVAAKGEGDPECEKFAKYYRSLCPGKWIERWNEQLPCSLLTFYWPPTKLGSALRGCISSLMLPAVSFCQHENAGRQTMLLAALHDEFLVNP
ncbi:hypothetical protein GUJ93_ZPchr0007g4662 [Zizania palustris]|uniref:Cytochrome c oxidase subunit 6b-1 n=1 Tax=Zizania palustris TaxID=103762 RepID=A0A8J5VSU8_ZIZPA|nr:hypothetical protein GUJ93_ZPchr0007g4662 [Zizania palustris]